MLWPSIQLPHLSTNDETWFHPRHSPRLFPVGCKGAHNLEVFFAIKSTVSPYKWCIYQVGQKGDRNTYSYSLLLPNTNVWHPNQSISQRWSCVQGRVTLTVGKLMFDSNLCPAELSTGSVFLTNLNQFTTPRTKEAKQIHP